MLVDNQANMSIKIGERDNRQNKGNHKDDDRVNSSAELLIVGSLNEKATPVFGALDVRLITVHYRSNSGRKEHRGGNEDGQKPNGRHDVLGITRLGQQKGLVPGDDYKVSVIFWGKGKRLEKIR